jgi:hypothetical protein
LSKIIFLPLFRYFGPKVIKIEEEIVLKASDLYRVLTDVPLWANLSRSIP